MFMSIVIDLQMFLDSRCLKVIIVCSLHIFPCLACDDLAGFYFWLVAPMSCSHWQVAGTILVEVTEEQQKRASSASGPAVSIE